MILLFGEVRKVIDKPYKTKSGTEVSQAVLVLEPQHQTQNIEIYLSDKQIKSGVVNKWLSLKGQNAAVMASLFVNYQYKFHKFTAAGEGLPLAIPDMEVLP